MRSILRSISYVEDSKKLLKGRPLNPEDMPLVYTLFPLFKKNYKGVLRVAIFPETVLVFRKYFIKKIELFGYKYIFQKLSRD